MNRSSQGSIRIISNLQRLEGIRTDRFRVEHGFVGNEGDFWDGVPLFFQSFRSDVVLLNNDSRRLLGFCLLRYFWPFGRCRLVSVDILLRRPIGWQQRLWARIKRLLLRKVDRFIHYFKDLEGYEKWYGISPAHSVYVPFKVNLPKIPPREEVAAEGEYVVTIGRSHRDLQTFIAAMRQVDYPGLLVYQDASIFRQHGTELDLSQLPSNLRAELHDGRMDTYNDFVRRAKLVVLPIVADCISAAGISNYLLAMAFQRCVIISEVPATRGLLSDQAIIVPPADPLALARAIRQAWEDNQLRERTADAGRRYAEQMGVETRLLRDIVEICGDLVTQQKP